MWRIALDRPPEDVAYLLGMLDADEQARAASFRDPCDRKRFVVGRAGLRLVLAADADESPEALQFQMNAWGKPHLSGDCRQFNFSRSGGTALLAIGKVPIGIDLERVRPIPEKERIADLVFACRERDWMLAVAEPERTARFFTLWTRKEALVKAAGRGLSDDLRGFDTLGDHRAAGDMTAWGERWRINELRFQPGVCAALAMHLGRGGGTSIGRCD